MGEGNAPETWKKIAELAEKDLTVVKIKNILSTYQLPEEVVLMLIRGFEDDLDKEEITEAIRCIRTDIKNEFKLVHYVIIQPE